MAASTDPYRTLGVSASASDAEVRAAYRKLVQLHHPDHNGGSEESERRFEEVQEAYARVREMRAKGAGVRGASGGGSATARGASAPGSRGRGARAGSPPPPPPPSDPDLEARMADLERELREANEAKERARRAARDAAAAGADPDDLRQRFKRATDEELGYIRTDDSFSKIFADAREDLSGRLSDAREHPVSKRVETLIDELEELLSKATRGPRS